MNAFGYHVELCSTCTSEHDFKYVAQAQILVDSSGDQQVGKTVVVGNLASKIVKAYRVTKIIEPGYASTSVTPISIPSQAAFAFQEVEKFFVNMEQLTGNPVNRVTPEVVIDIPAITDNVSTPSASILIGNDNLTAKSAVSNFLRMRLINSFWDKLSVQVRIIIMKADYIVLAKFADNSSALFTLGIGTISDMPFLVVDGSIILNGEPQQNNLIQDKGTINYGSIYNSITFGSAVMKCRSYKITTSYGETYTGTVCWYEKP